MVARTAFFGQVRVYLALEVIRACMQYRQAECDHLQLASEAQAHLMIRLTKLVLAWRWELMKAEVHAWAGARMRLVCSLLQSVLVPKEVPAGS